MTESERIKMFGVQFVCCHSNSTFELIYYGER